MLSSDVSKAGNKGTARQTGDGPHLRDSMERVCDTIVEQAAGLGHKTAVICGDDALSYARLVSDARQVARRLSGLPARRVGILAHRTTRTLSYVLGIHLSGRSFVFIDPDAPRRTRQHIIESAGITLTIDPRSSELMASEDIGPDDPWPTVDLDGEAYVLYTSGSTGKPKGVSVTHRNLASSNDARISVYRTFGTPNFLLLSPFFFDSSVAGVWGTLAMGGTLVVADEDERRDPRSVNALIERHDITHLLTVPTFYTEVLNSAGGGSTTLRVVVCAGETLSQNVLRQHFAIVDGVPLINEYGPTECTVWATCKVYDRVGASTIGFPIPGTSIRLLDDSLSDVDEGTIGQIAISGPTVAAGYVDDAAETAVKFVELPDVSGITRRTYLTGDLGRWSADGELEFLGREDNQVKIRGVRVSLDTVEQALIAEPGVQAAVLAHDSALSYAFVVGAPGAGLTAVSVRRMIETELGGSHVPDRVVLVDTLPRTARGKIDRSALIASAQAFSAETDADKHDSTDSDLTARIARAWEVVLGVPVDSAEDGISFFDLGGNSMSILKLSKALTEIAGKPISAGKVYRCATIEQQAKLLCML